MNLFKIISIITLIFTITLSILLYIQHITIQELEYKIDIFQHDRVNADDNLLESINTINDYIYK
jgi:hypothetical protein